MRCRFLSEPADRRILGDRPDASIHQPETICTMPIKWQSERNNEFRHQAVLPASTVQVLPEILAPAELNRKAIVLATSVV